ncbi:MAG: tetratricopeptide repeat protein [Gammaproteobacteria bacterium]|nr:tetratricopeptide repeat protein [Gammaproteobacteria bacterium]
MTTEQLIDSLQNYPQPTASNDPMVVDQQANEAFQSADYVRAAELYQRVIELAPHKVEPYNNLGLTLHYLGRSSEALTVLKRGSELDPRFQRIWLTLGFVQSGVGNVEEARLALQRAVDLGVDTPPGRNARELLDKLP